MFTVRIWRGRKSGFSQMEMLVVLGIVTALFGMAWPRLRAAHGYEQLRKAAQQVRVELMRARLRAIETGRTQVFSYRRGGGDFTIGPQFGGRRYLVEKNRWNDEDQESPRRLAHGDSPGERTGATIEESLPESIAFAPVDDRVASIREGALPNANPPRASIRPAVREGSAREAHESETAENAEWVELPPFLPDGTCNDARLSLTNEQGATVDVGVHGLTGIVTIGEARTAARQDNQARR